MASVSSQSGSIWNARCGFRERVYRPESSNCRRGKVHGRGHCATMRHCPLGARDEVLLSGSAIPFRRHVRRDLSE